jgi:aldehyde dehydrogenase (NAD+)
VETGATLATGGGRPKDLDRGWYIEPTRVRQRRQQVGHRAGGDLRPVLSVFPAAVETVATRIANDTIYGLHSAVFTTDVERAREVAAQMGMFMVIRLVLPSGP